MARVPSETPAQYLQLYPQAFGGEPVVPADDQPVTHLKNTAYEVDYSESHMDPIWAAYYSPATENFKLTRPKNQTFTTDTRTTSQVTTRNFSQSDYQTNPHAYDRGHMAPSYAIGRGYGRAAQIETFTCSNICPQEKYLNEQTWAAFEALVAGDYSTRFKGVWTFVGPIFSKPSGPRLNGKAEIPAAFFYVIIRVDADGPHALGVVMEQGVKGKRQPLRPFVKTVHEIEEMTGLQFFPNLSESVRTQLETETADSAWNVDQDIVAPAGGG